MHAMRPKIVILLFCKITETPPGYIATIVYYAVNAWPGCSSTVSTGLVRLQHTNWPRTSRPSYTTRVGVATTLRIDCLQQN